MNKATIQTAVTTQLRTSIALAVLFNEHIASSVGMTPSEMQTVHLLQLHGPLTPTQLAAATNLTSGSMTAVLDRLEHLHFIVRSPHSTDRRKVVITLDEAQIMKTLMPYYKGKADHTAAVISMFTIAELEVVNRFLTALNEEK